MGICTVFCQSVCDGLELEKKAITARRGVKRDPGRPKLTRAVQIRAIK